MSLYCEGRHKPLYRGVIHYVSALPLTVIGFSILFTQCNNDVLILTCASITSFCFFTCLFTSGLYHCYNWKKDAECYIAKLDHSFILLVPFGSYLPLMMYQLPYEISLYFTLYFILITICGFHWIMNGGKSTIPHLFTSSSILFVLRFFYDSWFALHIFLNLFIYFIGFIILKTKKPDPFPNTFGYHEIFHICVVISMMYTFFIHYSLFDKH